MACDSHVQHLELCLNLAINSNHSLSLWMRSTCYGVNSQMMKIEIKKSLGFDGLLKRWESASRMRQWINELKKEISERAIAEVEASSPTLNKTESENIADQKFEVELQ